MNKKDVMGKIGQETGTREEEIRNFFKLFQNSLVQQIIGEDEEEKLTYTKKELEIKKDDSLINASAIVVDCERNDRVDIRAGGPEYLGYTFLVETEQKEEMKAFIKIKLEENQQPLLYISDRKLEEKVQRKEIWTKTEIENCIVKSYEPKAKGVTITYENFAQLKLKK